MKLFFLLLDCIVYRLLQICILGDLAMLRFLLAVFLLMFTASRVKAMEIEVGTYRIFATEIARVERTAEQKIAEQNIYENSRKKFIELSDVSPRQDIPKQRTIIPYPPSLKKRKVEQPKEISQAKKPKKEKVQCTLCGCFVDPALLEKHKRKSHDLELKCGACHHISTSRRAQRDHIRETRHKVVSVTCTKYDIETGTICGAFFDKRSHLPRHMNKAEHRVQKCPMPLCNEKRYSFCAMQQHMKNDHANQEERA